MAAPVYYNVQDYRAGVSFQQTFSSSSSGGQPFDVGAAGDKTILAVAFNTASTPASLTSFELGGVTFTALTESAPDGTKQRLFYALAAQVSSLQGTQAWTLTAENTQALHHVQIYCASGNATLTDLGLQSQNANPYSFSSATTADDILVGLAMMQCGTGANPTSGVNSTILRNVDYLESINLVALEEPGGAGSALEASVATPQFSPVWRVHSVKLTGVASNPLVTPSGIASAEAFGTATVSTTGGGTITTDPLKNNAGTLLASSSVPKVVAIKLSDLSLTATWTNQTTDGSGVLTLNNASLVPGTNYLLLTSSADGSATGSKLYTAA
jgi:hypothetical protein